MPTLLEDRPTGPVFTEDAPRPLVEHLTELRARLISGLSGWGLATLAAYAAFPGILKLLMRPPVDRLVYTSPLEPFFAQLKVSVIVGLLVSFPWVMYQACSFVGAGLKPAERKVLFRLLPGSYLLFLLGAALGLFGIGPLGLKFLLSYSTEQLVPYITLNSYLGYLSYLTLGLAILFQLPIALFVLAALGWLDKNTLSRHRPHAVVGILVLAAIISPGGDIVTQLLIAAPTYVLFELSILAVRLSRR